MDVELGIEYLCTRFLCTTNGDWEKLRRLLLYLKSNIGVPRSIGANGLEILQTWVDASYDIHQYMRGYIGRLMAMVHGIIHNSVQNRN